MKKILIVAYFFPPENNGGTERVKNFYHYLKREGYDTYVLTADKFKKHKELACNNDEHVFRPCLLWYCLRAYDGLLRKYKINMPFFLFFAKILLFFWEKKIKPDICLASYPLSIDFEIGLYLKKDLNVKLVADFRDGLIYEPFKNVKNANKKYKTKMERIENEIVSHADLIITDNVSHTKYFENIYHVKAYTIPNGFDDLETINAEPLELSKNKKNVLYTGGIDLSRPGLFFYVKDALEFIFKTMDDWMFYFIGNYTEEEYFFLENFRNVKIIPKIRRQKVIATQRIADLLLLITGDAESGTSGKLYEYLFTEVPILNLGGDNNANRIINETNSGITIHPKSLKSIEEFLKNIDLEQIQYRRKNIEKYTRRNECHVLAELLSNLC